MRLARVGRTRTTMREDTLGVDPDLIRRAVRKRVLQTLVDTYVINPTARPRHAPMAIVGRNIPAGTCDHPDFR